MVLQDLCKISAMFENSFASSSPEEKLNSENSGGKKRRKQSNPTRYGNSCSKKLKNDNNDDPTTTTTSGAGEEDLVPGDNVSCLSDEATTREGCDDSDQEEDEYEDDLRSRSDLQYLCPHCPASFPSENLIKAHIEEEHVLQLLERQIRQYQFGRNGCLNGSSGGGGSGNSVSGAEQQELTEQQLSLLMSHRQGRPASRTSSRSSSLSQPESPTTGRQRGTERASMPRECVEREFGALLPFPLTSGIPSLATGPDGKAIPMFSPFLFPVMPASGGASNGSVNGSGNQGRSSAPSMSSASGSSSFCIFNPEAYCELCNKEFCNKYFLKTHKANKHGIYSGDAPTSGGSSGTNSNPSPGPTPSTTGAVMQAQTAVSAAAAAASAFFPAGLVSTAPHAAPEGPGQQVTAAAMAARIVGNVNPESYCEICQKPFCNKYFLKKHKQKIHGIQPDQQVNSHPPPSQDSQSSSPGRTADQGKGPSPAHSPAAVATAVLQMQQQQQLNGGAATAAGESGNSLVPYCNVGLKDFCNKYFAKENNKQKLHPELFDMQSVVSSIQKATSAGPPAPDNPSPLKRPLSRSPTLNQTPLPPVTPTNSPKNYCNICNKELCNKYFMKTHMLKMHGINIDEQPGEAAQASTIGGVTCDICQKELCSKYFLKVHKQNTHGIYEESAAKEGRGSGGRGNSSARDNAQAASSDSLAAGGASEATNEKENSTIAARGIDPKDTGNRYFSHYTEVCPLCQRRFKSIKWLKTHVLNDHSDLQPLRSVDPPLNDGETALSLVMGSKSSNGAGSGPQQQRESAASSPAAASLPPAFACLKWLRSHIPAADAHDNLLSTEASDCPRSRLSPQRRSQQQQQEETAWTPGKEAAPQGASLNPQFAIPQKVPVPGSSFIMQAFNISEPEEQDSSRPANFVPSLVYLPVARQIKHPVVVSFQLIPARTE